MRSEESTDGRGGGTFLSRARRRQFVECAIEALVEMGFAGATIAEVARRAGVAKSVVLYHYSSRTDLMVDVVQQVYDDAAPPIRAATAAAATERDRVAAYVRGCVTFTWTHQREAKAVLEIARNLRQEDGRFWDTARYNQRLIAVAQELLEAGQRAGEFGEFDAWTAAVLLRATIDSLSEQFMTDPTLDGPQVAEHLIQLVDRMILPGVSGSASSPSDAVALPVADHVGLREPNW